MGESIRLANAGDSDDLLAIYAPYVTDTVISFELEPPSPREFRDRVAAIAAEYPYLVHVENGRITGYAYAARHMERAGYRYNVSVSIYLRPECQGRGVGRMLYSRLLTLLTKQGYCNAYAGITVPNPKSIGIHESFGFTLAATYHRTGYKFGRWLDVVWLEKRLQEPGGEPRVWKISELEKDAVESVLRI